MPSHNNPPDYNNSTNWSGTPYTMYVVTRNRSQFAVLPGERIPNVRVSNDSWVPGRYVCECVHCPDGSMPRGYVLYDEREWDTHGDFTCDDCGSDYCPLSDHECYGSDGDYGTGSGIHNYSYKPLTQFFGTGDYFLGVELEISARGGSSAQPIYTWARENGAEDLFYCKEDGSVSGFEIVTHPMSPDYFRAFDWAGFFRMLNQTYPLASGEECDEHGLHVHISRSAFKSPVALARWSYLLNRHAEEVYEVARRVPDHWAQRSPHAVRDALAGYLSTEGSRRRYKAQDHWTYTDAGNEIRKSNATEQYGLLGLRKPLRGHYPERYRIANHQNSATVEIRVFKSTRSATEFRQSVGLVIDTAEYVRDLEARREGIRALTWDRFREYAEQPALVPMESVSALHVF